MACVKCTKGFEMVDRVAMLSKQAMDYAAEQYGPQRAGEKVWDPLTYDRKFAELIAMDCIATIRLHMPRNGVNSPENTISKQHINNIADLYGVALPIPPEVYEQLMAGTDHMTDKGYQIGTEEGYNAFVSKRNAGS
jgi:hypothetical protein